MRAIKEKMNEERIKSSSLSDLAIEKNLSFKKSKKMREKGDECFKKFMFFKNLNKALEEKNDNKKI